MKRGLVGSTPAYLLAGVMVLFPLLDTAVAVWPLQPGSTAWRFGAAGVLSRSLVTPLVGLVGALVVASVAGHPRARRLVGGAGLAGGLVLLVVLPLFALDAVQMRARVVDEGRASFLVSSTVAFLKTAAAAAVALAVARAGLRAPVEEGGDRASAGGSSRGVLRRD